MISIYFRIMRESRKQTKTPFYFYLLFASLSIQLPLWLATFCKIIYFFPDRRIDTEGIRASRIERDLDGKRRKF